MGKRAGSGEIRRWADGKYQKQSDGSWKPVIENKFKEVIDYAERAIKGEVQIERLSQGEEQGRLLGGRRNVEAAVLLGTGKRTDSKNSPEVQRALDSDQLLSDWAKSEGIFVNYRDKKYWDFIGQGAEANVYLKDENTVKKIVWYGFSHEDPLEYLDRIALHNFLFPEVPYTLTGVTYNDRGLAFIVEQPLVKGVENATKEEIKVDMENRGFVGRGGNMFTNSDYLVEDLHTGNVVKSPKGTLFYIDPIVRLNLEGEGYGGNRTYGEIDIKKIKKSMQLFPETIQRIKGLLSKESELTVESGVEVAKQLIEKSKGKSGWVESTLKEWNHDIEKSKKAQSGEIRTWSGRKMQKTATGWIPVKGGEKPKKQEEQPKSKTKKQDLPESAKNTSETALQGAIKGSSDPEVRMAAQQELERRKAEEVPQKEEEGEAEPAKKDIETKEGIEEEIKRLRKIDTDDLDEIKKISGDIQKLLEKRKGVLEKQSSERKVSFEEYRKGFSDYSERSSPEVLEFYEKGGSKVKDYFSKEKSIKEAVYSYRGSSYEGIRSYLSDPENYPENHKSGVTKDYAIFISEGLSKFISENKISESISLNRRVDLEGAPFFAKLKEGDMYEDKSFSSSSLRELPHFGEFNIEILAKKGSSVANIGNPGEFEYLVDKGSKFRVLKKSDTGMIVELL